MGRLLHIGEELTKIVKPQQSSYIAQTIVFDMETTGLDIWHDKVL